MSYKKKLSDGTYVDLLIFQRQIELFEDTEELKSFGLGPYLFIEFQRRVVWLFLVLSLVIGVNIYINWEGTGLG